MMRVTRQSPLTGVSQTRDLDITPEQYHAWCQGALIQVVMPQLSLGDREFLKTGYTEEDWAVIFPPDKR